MSEEKFDVLRKFDIPFLKCELSLCDLQESQMRGMIGNMVLMQYLVFCVFALEGKAETLCGSKYEMEGVTC